MKLIEDCKKLYSENKLISFFSFVGFFVLLIIVLYGLFLVFSKIRGSCITNITDWLQAIGSILSLVVAIVVAVIGYRFNQYIKIQNKLVGEESRPILEYFDIHPLKKSFIIKNSGTFEADDVVLFLFEFDENGEFKYKKTNIIDSLSTGNTQVIKFDGGKYQSNLIIYKNRISDVVHLLSFNLFTDNEETVCSVGSNVNGKNSPLNKEDYKNLISLLNIKFQATKYRDSIETYLDFENNINKIIKNY